LTCIALAGELQSSLQGRRLLGAEQGDGGDTLLMRFAGRRSAGWIVASSCGGESFLFISKERPDLGGRFWPAPLSDHLRDATVTGVAHGGMDRSLTLSLRREDTGESMLLVAELFAPRPRLYLLEEGTGKILSGFGVSLPESGAAAYERPAIPPHKTDPTALSADALAEALPEKPEERDLTGSLFGVGRALAAEAMARSDGSRAGVANALEKLISDALSGEVEPVVAATGGADGLPVALVFEPSFGRAGEVHPCGSVNEAVASSFFMCRRECGEQERRRDAAKSIRVRLRRTARTRAALEIELEEAGRADEHRRAGELILANMPRVRRGMAEVELPDPAGGEGTIKVALDPRLSPAENAAARFKKARKLQRKLAALPKRIEELRRREGLLAAELERLESGRGGPPAGAAGSGARPERSERKEKWPPGISPRRYVSSDGWVMYVGRNNKENDYITFRFAKPDDFWLHAQGVPGSHVILRREGRKDRPSSRCVEEAASVAAYFSKGRTSRSVPVVLTEKRYVRKPRKGKPGEALFTNERSLMVPPRLPGQRK